MSETHNRNTKTAPIKCAQCALVCQRTETHRRVKNPTKPGLCGGVSVLHTCSSGASWGRRRLLDHVTTHLFSPASKTLQCSIITSSLSWIPSVTKIQRQTLHQHIVHFAPKKQLLINLTHQFENCLH